MKKDTHFPPPTFRFGMRQVVMHKGVPGTVIGRAEHVVGPNTYLVRPIESVALTEGQSRYENELSAF